MSSSALNTRMGGDVSQPPTASDEKARDGVLRAIRAAFLHGGDGCRAHRSPVSETVGILLERCGNSSESQVQSPGIETAPPTQRECCLINLIADTQNGSYAAAEARARWLARSSEIEDLLAAANAVADALFDSDVFLDPTPTLVRTPTTGRRDALEAVK
ncbi:MAG: hypothetical protein AAF850_09105 [Pseudomonadota bacterium]